MALVDTENDHVVAFTGEVHPAAEVWPMLAEADLADLAASIKEHGLLDPLTLDPEGRLLDGRNRLAACSIAEKEPTFVVYDGDPVLFVIAKNSDRRHMSTGARAMAAAVGLADDGRRQNGRWRRGSVAINGSVNSAWQQRMNEAGLVIDFCSPDEVRKVIAGGIALDTAYKAAKAHKEASASYEVRRAALGEKAPDLVERVTDEASLLGAEAELQARIDDDERQHQLHIKWAQEASTAWAHLIDMAAGNYSRLPEVLAALNFQDRKNIKDAIAVIKKGGGSSNA